MKDLTSQLGRFRRGALVLGLAAACAALFGCGGSVGSYCNEAANCEGGNDLDEEACNIRFQELVDVADLKNCGSEFDAYFECIDEGSRCNEERYRPDDGACAVQEEELQQCIE